MVNLSEQHLLLVGVGTELFVGRDELVLAQPELLETVEQLAVLLVNLGDRIGAAHSCQTTGRLLSLGAQILRLDRSEEHTSELQSLMRISYAVFCLKKKSRLHRNNYPTPTPQRQHTPANTQ